MTIDDEGLKKETYAFDTFTSSLTEMRHWLGTNRITPCSNGEYGVFRGLVFTILRRIITNVWLHKNTDNQWPPLQACEGSLFLSMNDTDRKSVV